MGRPLEKKYNGKMSFNFSAFTRAALLVYAANFNLPAQGANERIILERVEADGLQDAVALRALEMVQADAPAPLVDVDALHAALATVKDESDALKALGPPAPLVEAVDASTELRS